MKRKQSPKPPFDPIQAAVKVRQGTLKFADLKPEEVALTRAALQHSGKLRTALIRSTPDRPNLPPASHFGRALS